MAAGEVIARRLRNGEDWTWSEACTSTGMAQSTLSARFGGIKSWTAEGVLDAVKATTTRPARTADHPWLIVSPDSGSVRECACSCQRQHDWFFPCAGCRQVWRQT